MRTLSRLALFTLVLASGAFSIAFSAPAQASNHAQGTGSLFHRADSKRAPGKGASFTSTVTGEDRSGDNWAGFTVGSGSGNGFKGVEGNWNAECTSGPTNASYSFGSWVGLGGYFDAQLEQAGIALQTDGTYRLFWEYVGDGSGPFYDMKDVIHCGDHLFAWVHFGSSYCSNGGFYAHVEDTTTGAHLGSRCVTKSQGYGIQSGDWIDERPLARSCGGPTYLADFNWTDWSNVLAQPNNTGAGWAGPNTFVNTKLFMHDFTTNADIAYPDQSSVTSSNTFTDRWHAPGTFCD